MTEESNNHQQEEKKAGCLGIGFSVLFPFIGIILYFLEKKSVKNPNAYIYAALTGFVIGLILNAISSSEGV